MSSIAGGKYVVVLPDADVVWCGVSCGKLLVVGADNVANDVDDDEDDDFSMLLLDAADDLERELLRDDVGESVPPSKLGDWLALLRPPEAFLCK